jgi:hypothetical protein
VKTVTAVDKWKRRKTMSKEEMEKMLDEVFKKVFGSDW